MKGRLFYNAGRVVTYSLLGVVAGIVGHLFTVSGFQKELSILAGVMVLLSALFSYTMKGLSSGTIIYRVTSAIKSLFRKLFGSHGWKTLFLIGLVNGLLPCGFVFIALASASTSSTALDGFLYMLLFGAGTVPAMFLVSMVVPLFPPSLRGTLSRSAPYVSMAVAALLIYRGVTLEPADCCRHH
jgi:sulfite exporter TauE/SafE